MRAGRGPLAMEVGEFVRAKSKESVLDERASDVAARSIVVIGRFSGKQAIIGRGTC